MDDPELGRNFFLYWVIYLYYIGYYEVEYDKHCEYPKAYEKEFWKVAAWYIDEHVACDEPIVDYHNVE